MSLAVYLVDDPDVFGSFGTAAFGFDFAFAFLANAMPPENE